MGHMKECNLKEEGQDGELILNSCAVFPKLPSLVKVSPRLRVHCDSPLSIESSCVLQRASILYVVLQLSTSCGQGLVIFSLTSNPIELQLSTRHGRPCIQKLRDARQNLK